MFSSRYAAFISASYFFFFFFEDAHYVPVIKFQWH